MVKVTFNLFCMLGKEFRQTTFWNIFLDADLMFHASPKQIVFLGYNLHEVSDPMKNRRKYNYHIWSNYRTVRLRFSKLLGTLSFGKICIYLLRVHCKKDQERTWKWLGNYFFLIFFIKAYVLGTLLNCINKLMQFKWVPTTYVFMKK